APEARDAETLAIAGAERLSLKFQGYAELSGEYRIGAEGEISIPVLGRVSLRGMTASELEAALAERMARITGRQAYITVEVAEYRAVFVTGYVTHPGSFSWRPGLTVLHAQALAGGIYRAVVSENGIVLSDDTELERLQKAISQQKRNLAVQARL